jgi:hypothetical protein
MIDKTKLAEKQKQLEKEIADHKSVFAELLCNAEPDAMSKFFRNTVSERIEGRKHLLDIVNILLES